MRFFNFFYLWQKIREFRKSTSQPNLFDYAQQQAELENSHSLSNKEELQLSENSEKFRGRRFSLSLVLILFVSACSFLLLGWLVGYSYRPGLSEVEAFYGQCIIDRQVTVYPYRGSKRSAYLQSLTDGWLSLLPNTQKKLQSSLGFYKINLDKVKRIDLYPPKRKGNQNASFSLEARSFIGRYRIKVATHRGLLYIYRRPGGRLGASVRFTNWGKQTIEFLSGVRVRGKNIYFRRICRGKTCTRIGSARVLNQRFEGILSPDKKKIVGNYTGGHSSSRWWAVRY